MSETTFTANAQPATVKEFGKLKQTLTYNADGTVATVKDGNNRTTTLSNWYRGIPRAIGYPDSTSESAVVNAQGWITSTTDENGYATNYTYDTMGRLASIAYPTGDSVAWNTTTLSFVRVTGTEYGIPAGHWRQTVSTGNARKITYYDALWRPLVTREYDTGNETATKRFQRFTYDHEGRATFASYPGTTDALSTGTWTDYDALGRVTSVSQDSEQGLLTTLTQYQTGFKTKVTNPKGNQTTTSFMVYDQPSYDWPVAITHPAGAYTHISRDAYGKTTKIRRSNSSSPTGGSLAVNRTYTYNSYQELCRSVEPETGATLMGYDAAGNLKWSAAGLSSSQACETNGTSTNVAHRRVDRTYDARNRLLTLSFPDGKGDQTWTYTPDGLPATVSASNPNVANPSVTEYTYNRRRLMTQERLSHQGNGSYWGIWYVYDSNGHLSSLTYPSSLSVGYSPNALGQPTRAGSYATGVSYYPNGAIKQFTYGNGIVHAMTQNARQLPARSTDCTVAGADCLSGNKRLDFVYDYDSNGNVAKIQSYDNAWRTRTMTYDGLDRLTQTVSPSQMFGTASYTYDVLDNLTRVNVSGGAAARDHYYCYDGTTRRLSNIKTGSCSGSTVIGLEYDVQGNLSNKSGQIYSFDYGNRLRSATGKEWYAYDGHGRRIYSCSPTACGSQMYGFQGQLLYMNDSRNGKRTDHIYLGGSLVALRERPVSGSTVTVKYQHTDALGSATVMTDVNKNFVEKTDYEPYGKVLNRGLRDDPGYTGHMEDAATGLNYMQQRYYDPMIGRFLSVDPVTAYSNGDMRFFNRYAYAFNNPYRFTDPDGRCPVCVPLAIVGRLAAGAALGAVVNTGVQMAMGEGTLRQRFDNVDGRQVAVAAGAGALSGGVSAIADTAKTVGGALLANVVGNAGVGALATQVSAQVDGKTASASEVLKGAALSGGTAGLGAGVAAAPGAIAKTASAGMSQTQRTATANLLGGIKNATPGFKYSNPVQTGANAAGAAVSASGDLKPLIEKKQP
ncbi:RHS repeat-associated core domain-containing protein [Pseudoxanthomonas kalamensis]|uniref:RHS repeat-associated core domain-containing protein n=1 Tax=Pseudoxanthomonas kalamensis TaxID=289483 RepID=UPI001B85BFC3|nr:RHS repeat-associated core domain-containing protein [Pseudoxanthomonas kalamensis]